MSKPAQSPEEAMKAIRAAMESMEGLGSEAKSRSKPEVQSKKKLSPNTVAAPASQKSPKQSFSKPQVKTPKIGFGQWLARFVKGGLATVTFIALSPILLIKASLWLHVNQDVNPWLSLIGSAGALALLSALVTAIFTAIVFRKNWLSPLFKSFSFGWLVILLPILLFAGLAGYKSPNLAKEAQQAHPILRSAVSVVALFDGDVVLTDIARSPQDYQTMGLTPFQASKHYPQADGYVHAVDLRTIGKAEWKNVLLEWSFKGMGFNTLRHTGTADHLHIALTRN